MEQGKEGRPRKMVSSKCLQVIQRQSNFGRLEKCLKKQNKKKATTITTKTNFKAVVIALRREQSCPQSLRYFCPAQSLHERIAASGNEIETRVNAVKEKFRRNCLQVSRKKQERGAALVIGKMPKLGNSYNLLRQKRATRQGCRFFCPFTELDK